MKRLPVPPIDPSIVGKIRQSIDEKKNQEEVFSQMRLLGLFMGESIKLASELYAISPTEAKIAVHYSKTWADCRESNDTLHESLFQSAREIGFEPVEQLHAQELAQSTR